MDSICFDSKLQWSTKLIAKCDSILNKSVLFKSLGIVRTFMPCSNPDQSITPSANASVERYPLCHMQTQGKACLLQEDNKNSSDLKTIYFAINRINFFLSILAYRPAPRTFQLALRGYSVASLPHALRSHLARFAHAHFALRTHENFRKKSVSQSTQNALKRKKGKKKKFTPLTDYLPHVTSRVPRSVHAKFHADRSKTVAARGIRTNRQTDRATLII